MPKETLSSMTMRRIRMKFHSKRALPGSWLRSIFLVLILTLVTGFSIGMILPTVDPAILQNPPANTQDLLKLMFPNPITKNYLLLVGTMVLLYWLVASPLQVGTAHFFTGVARLQKPKLPSAFAVFCNLGLVFRSMMLSFWVGFLRMLWCVLFLMPYLFVMAMAQMTQSVTLLEVSLLLLLAGFLLYSFQSLSYTPALYLFADDPTIGVFDAIKKSREITRGHLVEIFCLELSFLLWRAFAAYTAFIGTAFFLPYYHTTMAVFVDSLRVRNDPTLTPQTEEAPKDE